jgi:hypothetical protein
MSRVFKPYSELYSSVRNDTPNFRLWWRFALNIGAVEDASQNFVSDGIKKNLWIAGTGALKSKGITLKSNIGFVSVCL